MQADGQDVDQQLLGAGGCGDLTLPIVGRLVEARNHRRVHLRHLILSWSPQVGLVGVTNNIVRATH